MRLQKLAKTVLILLGAFFVITGAAKIFVFNSFAATISAIISTSSSTSKVIAGFIVSAEVAGGVLLVLRFKLRLVAILICVMLSAYIWVLYSSILQGREIECNCLGILNMSLPNFLELVLDFFIFDVTAFMALVITPRAQESKSSRFTISTLVIIVVILSVQFGMLSFAHDSSHAFSSSTAESQEFFTFVKNGEGISFGRTGGNSLILLLNFYDFKCSLCSDDFSALSDSIAKHYDNLHGRVIAVFESNEIMSSWSSSHLEQWAQANQIVYPIIFASDQMFKQVKISKSSAVVFSSNGNLLFQRRIPIGYEGRKEVLRLILGN